MLHKNRNRAILARVGNLDNVVVRHLIFTVPEDLRRTFFFVRINLNDLFHIVKGVLKRHFGVKIGKRKRKKGTEPIYRLDDGAIAVLHLFGGESPSYHPHIHVLLFERRGNGIKCRLSPEQLRNLRESYRKALRTLLLRSVPKTVVHHRYASSPAAIKRLIRYVCTPFDPDTIQGKCAALDIYIMDLIIQDLHNFNFWRAWGPFANNRKGQHSRGDVQY